MSYTEMNFGNGGGASSAEKVSYNNSTSGLSADNVQGAIDEVDNNSKTIYHKDLTLSGVSVSYSAYVERVGNVVKLVISTQNAINASSGWSVVIIPNGYVPSSDSFNFFAFDPDKTKMMSCSLYGDNTYGQTRGNLVSWASLSANVFRLETTYFTKDAYPTSDAIN